MRPVHPCPACSHASRAECDEVANIVPVRARSGCQHCADECLTSFVPEPPRTLSERGTSVHLEAAEEISPILDRYGACLLSRGTFRRAHA